MFLPLPVDNRHWPRIQELFLAAVELPPEARLGFVERSEADPAIRAMVLALIAADADPAAIFKSGRSPPAKQSHQSIVSAPGVCPPAFT